MKRMYVVQALVKELETETIGIAIMRAKIQMNWADGMVGVLPVFSNKKDAKKYAGNKFPIAECEERQVVNDRYM